MDLQKILKSYDFPFPKELIAQQPTQPRDAARLLVYNRKSKKLALDIFRNIGNYLPKNSVLVFNQTKVVPARLSMQKATGGKVELLYISHDKNFIKALSNKPLNPNDLIGRSNGRTKMQCVNKEGSIYFFKPLFPISKIHQLLQKYGKTPLPPYIKHSPLKESAARKEYQSVFAKKGESVAAPTASLHFTKGLIRSLKKQGIEVEFVTLNVGLGTFAPLREENLMKGQLHLEFYEIDQKTITRLNNAKKNGKRIIAVGTTVVRTLESAAKHGKLMKNYGDTKLFIHPPYKFKFVDGMITNFHVPKSSLLMLVSVFAGRKEILRIYQHAIEHNFRLFSFGDGMLLL